MATYSAVSASEKDADSPITVGLIDKLDQNPHAIAEGASGAPKIQAAALDSNCVTAAKIASSAVGQSEIASGAVHRSELETATASGSTNITSDSSNDVALTGGDYSWWTGSGEEYQGTGQIVFGHGDTAAGVLGLYNLSANRSLLFYRNERYIQSSPPYDMGDGEIPLFIFLLIDNATGEPCCIEVAQDPTWAYHGPTDITPDRMDKAMGRKYKRVRMIEDSGLTPSQARLVNAELFNEYRRGRKALETHEIEIDATFKNSDMNIASNPWVYNKPDYFAGKTPVLLNPFASPMQHLYDLQSEVHASEVRDLIQENHFSIKNESLNLKGPQGVQVVDFDWRKTMAR